GDHANTVLIEETQTVSAQISGWSLVFSCRKSIENTIMF
uniref:Uncharacterized protein n=1 Tax=Caenorhabditis japonica TaxID=281687 RepID=A0A8R1IAB7_CAEJA